MPGLRLAPAERPGQALLVKSLLPAPATAAGAEIVYRDLLRYDYATLHQRIARLAHALRALGVRPGDTVAVMDWDSHRYLECFFAVPMLGAVLHTVNVRLEPGQLHYTLQHGGAGTVLVHADFLPLLGPLLPRLESVRKLLVLADGDGDEAAAVQAAGGGAAGYEALLAAAGADFRFPDFDENALATTFYTTGTTGRPKGVCFTHRQLVLHTLALAAMLGTAGECGRLHREDVYMPLTPMFHVHAWGLPYLATMLGLKQVYPGAYQPAVLGRLLTEEGVSFSHCVPSVLQMLLSHPALAETGLGGWKVIIGGSALPEALVRAALARGIEIHAGYGLSETCPVLSVMRLDSRQSALPPAEQCTLRTRAGYPMPLSALQVVDEAMNPLPWDGRTQGEVVARAPWLTAAYQGEEEASAALWWGGWLHTGDVGTLSPDGCLQLLDRIKDVIKVGGEWVSSLVLEDIIAAHPAVREVAVIAVADRRWGERPLALVVPVDAEPAPVDVQAIRHFAVRALGEAGASRYAATLKVMLVDRLLRTSVGKLNKRLMREDPMALARRG